MIARAREGLYDDLAMGQGLSPELRQRYFIRAGRRWHVTPALKARVCFAEANLLDGYDGAPFDAIFCRYTALYFEGPKRQLLLEHLDRALRPDGVLFLGASEILGGELPQLVLATEAGGIHYRRRQESGCLPGAPLERPEDGSGKDGQP
jgi:chemotaxis methyl-accepting protein methylase